MKEKNTLIINGEPVAPALEATLAVEQFLNDNYLFRRNKLNGKVEFSTKSSQQSSADAEEPADDSGADYRPLTQEALNSIIRRAKREQLTEKGSPKTDIIEYIYSEDVPSYDPIGKYLEDLPAWDGQNHIASLFSRLPGLSSEQLHFLTVWLRSAVAHWLQMDTMHGNECVPTLIGDQGCGKTTFFQRLLPQDLRQYYLDHLNLSNKFDKDMALTNNLLVNLDELETIRPSQHASLKQTLSKSKVNGRAIYQSSQDDRPRYASFVATTNNHHPLSDTTGSRRYICITIPKGQLIDNTGDIDYKQLYAQVKHELTVLKTPYWFNNEEVARIQVLNQNYMAQKDLAEIIDNCFRKPNKDETAKVMNTKMLLELIQKEYPNVSNDRSTKIKIGLTMKELGYEHCMRNNIPFYKVIALAA